MTIQTKIEKNLEKRHISKKDKKNAQMRKQKNNLEKIKDNMKIIIINAKQQKIYSNN